jgi:hypothetical protein
MSDWLALSHEILAWGRQPVTLWWRDDDAAEPSAALERILGLAGGLGAPATPLALAVIPARAQAALARRLSGSAHVEILQHGYAHANHAPPPEKKSELGPHRPLPEMAAEIAAGRDRLAALFGPKALPVMVPPWNRIGDEAAACLAGLGFRGLSRYRPRPAGMRFGLILVNAHVDLVDWRGGRDFIGVGSALAALVGHLRDRRQGRADGQEPTGILTHHAVQPPEAGAFMAELLARTRAHETVRWLSAAEAFGLANVSNGQLLDRE